MSLGGIDEPMKFEELRDSIEALLVANQTGRFRTVTEQKQSTGAEQHLGLLRSVQIFYSDGNYPDAAGAKRDKKHQTVFTLVYTVVEQATANLNALLDPEATEPELLAAMAGEKTASYRANRSMDTLRRMVTQILLDPILDGQLGMPLIGDNGTAKQVTNAELTGFHKDSPISRGKLFELTASEQIKADVQETFAGAPVTEAVQPAIQIDNNFTTQTDPPDATPAESTTEINTEEEP